MDRRSLLLGALGLAVAGCAQGARRALDRPASTRAGTPRPTSSDPRGGRTRRDAPDDTEASDEQRDGSSAEAPGEGSLVVPVICREAWGARPAGPDLGTHTVQGLMVHHDAAVLADNSQAPARLRSHQRFHMDQGWGDIAYHLAVDREGNAYELRDRGAPGDTATDYDPAGWYLVVALGNFERQQPTDAQVEVLTRVLAAAADRYGIDPAAVAAHRDHASTSCPGDALYARLPELRARSTQLSGRVRTEQVCGSEARRRVRAVGGGT